MCVKCQILFSGEDNNVKLSLSACTVFYHSVWKGCVNLNVRNDKKVWRGGLLPSLDWDVDLCGSNLTAIDFCFSFFISMKERETDKRSQRWWRFPPNELSVIEGLQYSNSMTHISTCTPFFYWIDAPLLISVLYLECVTLSWQVWCLLDFKNRWLCSLCTFSCTAVPNEICYVALSLHI